MTGEADYQNRLGDALETVLEEGAQDLETIATGLNRLNMMHPSGVSWTAANLEAEFERLAATGEWQA